MELPPNGAGLTGARGSGEVPPEEEELTSTLEVASDTHCPTVPRRPEAALATAEALVPMTFVRARLRDCTCTAVLAADAFPEE